MHNIQEKNPYNQKLKEFYPFTSYDPSAPWYERLRLRFIGESAREENLRKLHLGRIKNGEFIPRGAPNANILPNPEFVQGSSRDTINSPYDSGWRDQPSPIKPSAPIPPIDDDVLIKLTFPQDFKGTIAGQLGAGVKPIESPILLKIDEMANQWKIKNLPSTPTAQPVSSLLTPEVIDSINNQAEAADIKGKAPEVLNNASSFSSPYPNFFL